LSYRLKVQERKGHLHVVATGANGLQTVKSYLQEAARECVARGHKRLLIEERLEGPRLGTLDVFEIVTHGAQEARKVLDLIAYVDIHSTGALMKLAAGLASQMGLSIRLFPTVEEASQWLEKGADEGLGR